MTAPRVPGQDLIDPFGIGTSLVAAAQAWLGHPQELAASLARLAVDQQRLNVHALQVAFGLAEPHAIVETRNDERFVDPVWSTHPAYSLLKQYYLLYVHWLEDALYDTPDVPARERRKAAFWARQWLDAIAPTNFYPTNPVAQRHALDSGGRSLVDGLKILLDDVAAGDVQMVDRTAFEVGRNLATTPGAVVHRNRLLELIQYAPSTPQVRRTPIVVIPPWINKYYVLDLNERKSLLRHLVAQGWTVFVVSWRNATPDLGDVRFDDYLSEGVNEAIEVARDICGVPQVHAAGYCLGGTALAAWMAWANRRHAHAADVPVAHWTLLTTLLDFSRPGGIEVFLDEASVALIERMMAARGYLDGSEMANAFRMLRPNSLIWHYVVHGYLYGEKPPAFDVLYWNTDSTRMPAAMHAFYLREFYLKNRLIAPDGLTLAGEPIDLRRIRQPLYAVGCEEDHIAPWKATFHNTTMIDAPARYTLTASGHILGIVNPPVQPPRRSYWTGPARDDDPDRWRADLPEIAGSWWEDWTAWLAPLCGDRVPARAPGSDRHPALCPAPGTYVLER